jgi:tRNA threonylcarbamoyladenosine biosynthesis protein TsaB
VILGLRTDTPECQVRIGADEHSWEAGRGLADGLLGYLEDCLAKSGASFEDITGLVVFRGPGSFTGLRIGITVMNTIASARHIPIIGVTGDSWLEDGKAALSAGRDDRIVLPLYGSEPHITAPKK